MEPRALGERIVSMSAVDPEQVVSISAVLGDYDAENRAWQQAIRELRRQVGAACQEDLESPLQLDVSYHVEGKLAPNEFEGVRTGHFTKRTALLRVQAAVPPGPVDDRRAVLLDLLADAVAVAEAFARKKGIAEELTGIRALVRELSVD